MIVVWSAAAAVLLGLAALGFRYARFRAVRGLVDGAAGPAAGLSDPALRRDLLAHLAYLRQRLARGWLHHKRDAFLGRVLREARTVARAARGELAEPHLLPGHHVIAAVSKVDNDTPLPISVTVPPEWDGRSLLPLVLHLHGGGVGPRDMARCFPAPALPGALCMAPVARGSHDYMGVAMTAVDEAVAEVRRRYPVGPLYVLGMSMGGLGTWLYAQRHVREVTGISPWAGNSDPAAWQGRWQPPAAPPRSPAARAAAQVRAARSPIARVGQLARTPALPVYVGHGTADAIIPIAHSEAMAGRLAELGAVLRFDRFDGLGHRNIPRRRAGRLAWLQARGRARAGAEGRFTAVIPPLTFVANCLGAPPHRVVDPTREARLDFTPDGRILSRSNVEPWAAQWPSKLAYPGPAGWAFEQPFAIALPADAPPHVARCVEDFQAVWSRRYAAVPRCSDSAQGFAVFDTLGLGGEARTLLAVGSPEENPAVEAALAGADVAVSPGTVRLFAHEFHGRDIGVAILRPHPRLRGAATLVVWGSTPASYRQLWHRFGRGVDWEGDRGRWWFDVAVFDRATAGPETFLAAGFFDHQWRFEPRLLFRGSSERRRQMPGTHWPGAGPPHGAACRWLSARAPDRIDTSRGPVAFDRSAGVDAGALRIHGKAYERGIGVVPPAAVAWTLPGGLGELRTEVGLQRTNVQDRFPVRHRAERVRFEVWGDGRRLAASRVLTSADPPEPLRVPLGGIRAVELRAVHTTPHLWHYGPVGWGHAELLPAR